MMKSKTEGILSVKYAKIIRIMKLLTFFLFCAVGFAFATGSYSQNTLLTLKLENKSVKEAFKAIEKKSEYVFFYYKGNLDENRLINLDVKQETIHNILDRILEGTGNSYWIDDRQVYIVKAEEKRELAAQQPVNTIRIRGNVTDMNSTPLVGVVVVVKNDPTRGVVTDTDGNYTIDVPNRQTVLEFRYVGFIPGRKRWEAAP